MTLFLQRFLAINGSVICTCLRFQKGNSVGWTKVNCYLIARHVGYVSNKNGLETLHTPSLSIALMISVNSPFIFSSKPHKSPIIRLSYIWWTWDEMKKKNRMPHLNLWKSWTEVKLYLVICLEILFPSIWIFIDIMNKPSVKCNLEFLFSQCWRQILQVQFCWLVSSRNWKWLLSFLFHFFPSYLNLFTLF